MNGSARIRVLHVIDSFDLGGAQTVLLDLLRHTSGARFETEVAVMHGRGVFWERFVATGVPVCSLSPRKWLPLYLPRLIGLIRRFRPHVIHCHLFGSNWIAKPLAAWLGVPVRISHDHCNDGLRSTSRVALALDALTNRWSSHVCAVSASTREFLLARERLPAARVSVIYNGVDLARFSAPRERPRRERFVVLGVGRLTAQKNFALFLEVAAALLRRGHAITFRIAGTGPEERTLRRLATALGIDAHVAFLGHISDTAQLYAEADALLMTSRYEGTPITALEAMAMRLPIVAPRLDGLSEILADDVDALLAPPNESEALIGRMDRLLREPGLRSRLADSAERKVREHYSAQAMTAQVEALYERLFRI